MPSETQRPRHHARVASAIPGRLRVKLHPAHRGQDVMDNIKRGLAPAEGVHDVKLNRSTGSITVRYDHTHHTTNSVLGLLQDLDVVAQSMEAPGMEEPEAEVERTVRSEGFLAAVNDLNRRVFNSTGVPVDLKIILPLTFAGAGLWSISKRGLMIESVPGWLFLWFAFDMFVKLHPAPR